MPHSSGGLSGVAGQMLGVGGDLIAKLSFDKEHQEERRRTSGSIEHAIGGVARVKKKLHIRLFLIYHFNPPPPPPPPGSFSWSHWIGDSANER